jgi:membrane fusion protein (multidrug efflux system)
VYFNKEDFPMKLAESGKVLLVVFLSSVTFLFAALLLSGCRKEEKEATPAPPTVDVVAVIQKDEPIYMQWVASTDGLVNADIRAQVQGYLIKQDYKEGDFVKKGQVLFEIDPRLYESALNEAQGQLGIYEAQWQTAKQNLNRIRPLAAQNAVSQKDLDDAVGLEAGTHASVLAAQAAVDKARVDLGFTKVTSLIDGIAGIANANIGDLVGPASPVPLTTVSTVNPILVYVPASEQQYMTATEQGKRSPRVIHLILADGTEWPHTGEFAFANRQVDPKTGTIKVAILFPNPGNVLRPGQFARVRAQMQVKKGALLVPQRAVAEMQGVYLVAVVGPDNKVDIRRVKPGETVDSMWIIDDGLKPGERVVAEGIQKVKQGMLVSPKPFEADAEKEPGVPSKPQNKPELPAVPEKR